MQIENLWTGILAMFLGTVLLIAFYDPVMTIINVNDSDGQLFVAIIAIITFFIIGVSIPIGSLTNDDRGRIT